MLLVVQCDLGVMGVFGLGCLMGGRYRFLDRFLKLEDFNFVLLFKMVNLDDFWEVIWWYLLWEIWSDFWCCWWRICLVRFMFWVFMFWIFLGRKDFLMFLWRLQYILVFCFLGVMGLKCRFILVDDYLIGVEGVVMVILISLVFFINYIILVFIMEYYLLDCWRSVVVCNLQIMILLEIQCW